MQPIRSALVDRHTTSPAPRAAPAAAAAPLPDLARMPASAAPPLDPARVTPPPASSAAAAAAALLAAAPAADAKAANASTIDCVNRFGAMILHSMHTKTPNGSHIFFPPGALKVLIMLLRGTNNLNNCLPALNRLATREHDAKFNAAQALKDLSRDITRLESQVACGGPIPPIVTFGTALCTNGDVNKGFSDIVKYDFKGEIIPDANAARAWIADQIKNESFLTSFMPLIEPLLTEMAKPEMISILQLLYIHLLLQDVFDENLTVPKPFFCSDGTVKVVQVMQQTRNLPVFDGPDFIAVKLQFSSAKQSCFIFIPKNSDLIGSLLERIPELLKTVPQQMQSKGKICFEMPRINMEGIIDLLEIFVENGLIDKKTVYDLIDARCKLKDLKQAVKWRFTERDMIAAGFTLASSERSCDPSKPRPISATTPFILCIASNEAIPLCLLQATFGDDKFFEHSDKDCNLIPIDLTRLQGQYLAPEDWQPLFGEVSQYTHDTRPRNVSRYIKGPVVLTAVNCTDHRVDLVGQFNLLIDGKTFLVAGELFSFPEKNCDLVIWKRGGKIYITDVIGTFEIDLEKGQARELQKSELDQLKATPVVAEADVKMGNANVDPMKHLAPLMMPPLSIFTFDSEDARYDALRASGRLASLLENDQFNDDLIDDLKVMQIEISQDELEILQTSLAIRHQDPAVEKKFKEIFATLRLKWLRQCQALDKAIIKPQ